VTETVRYPAPGQVTLSGRLAPRYQGNRGYLTKVYETRRDWMLEPFQNRGRDWVIEPLRSGKQELNWAGEYAGKWLDAATRVAAGAQDARLRQQAGEFAASLIATQEADGYLGIEMPEKRGVVDWDLWNVKYSLTGLLTDYELNHTPGSLQAAVRGGEWLITRFGAITNSDSAFYRSPSEGGVSVDIVDQLVRLYQASGDRRFLDFVTSVLDHFAVLDQMRASHEAVLTHAYMLTSYLGGLVKWTGESGRQEELGWVERVWEDIRERHVYPTGSLGFREHLRETAPNDTPIDGGQPDRHHQETCATVEWLFFNARLHAATGKARYAQAMEQTIYNALLAAQSTDGLGWLYYLPLRYEKTWFSGPTSCCYWSGPRGVARLPDFVYAVDGEGIRVNLYESSRATLSVGGQTVGVEQNSLYPDIGRVTLQIRPEKPLSFTLRLRVPAHTGSPGFTTLNGEPIQPDAEVDGYYQFHRQWSDEQLQMQFRIPTVVQRFLNDDYGVLVRGPEVVAVDQRDNPALDLDQIALQVGMTLDSAEPADGRRRYAGQVQVNGQAAEVVFTPYADCGGDGARFRTAFPVAR
jgi:DUF1680 family protein